VFVTCLQVGLLAGTTVSTGECDFTDCPHTTRPPTSIRFSSSPVSLIEVVPFSCSLILSLAFSLFVLYLQVCRFAGDWCSHLLASVLACWCGCSRWFPRLLAGVTAPTRKCHWTSLDRTLDSPRQDCMLTLPILSTDRWLSNLSFALSSGRRVNHRDRDSAGRDESKKPSRGSSC